MIRAISEDARKAVIGRVWPTFESCKALLNQRDERKNALQRLQESGSAAAGGSAKNATRNKEERRAWRDRTRPQ